MDFDIGRNRIIDDQLRMDFDPSGVASIRQLAMQSMERKENIKRENQQDERNDSIYERQFIPRTASQPYEPIDIEYMTGDDHLIQRNAPIKLEQETDTLVATKQASKQSSDTITNYLIGGVTAALVAVCLVLFIRSRQ
jgi:hypothetical protein